MVPPDHFCCSTDGRGQIYCAENGIPNRFPAPRKTQCSPATFAAEIVQGSAESLSGLVLAQLARAGAPFIYGAFPTVMDMKTTIFSYGAAELSLMAAALAQMAQHYRLPFFGTAGATDAKYPDPQAAAEVAFSCLASALVGANLVHDVGCWLDHGSLASPGFLVLVQIMRSMQCRRPSKRQTPLNLIDQVGPDNRHRKAHQPLSAVWASDQRRNIRRWRPTGASGSGNRQKRGDGAPAGPLRDVQREQPDGSAVASICGGVVQSGLAALFARSVQYNFDKRRGVVSYRRIENYRLYGTGNGYRCVEFCKALGDDTRQRICECCWSERCVGDMLQRPTNPPSHHLNILKQFSLVWRGKMASKSAASAAASSPAAAWPSSTRGACLAMALFFGIHIDVFKYIER
jgi:hypothetical protein